ncbi:MAG: acyl-CoA dehydrogenase C-terminal domain-containing protein [Proteobacteria bacterium]|nr:acyl-CoA dehydrogenase C-terminal domain-containing protein [Pseudomonadota bacterium]
MTRESLSELTIGWLLLRQAEVAATAVDDATGDDADFYTGKVASARWFARTALPKTALRRRQAEAEDGWLMNVPETAF